MTLADAAPQSSLSFGGIACAGLCCLFALSALALAVVLVRRSRRSKSDGQA